MKILEKLNNVINNFQPQLKVDIEFLEYIEDYLIQSGVYVDCVSDIMNYLVKKIVNKKVTRYGIVNLLKERIINVISPYAKSIEVDEKLSPYVILVCGTNGSGKTTMIGKMSHLLSKMEWKVTIAACDTFRSGAEEQLILSTNFANITVIKGDKSNSSPSHVLMKAFDYAKQNANDVFLIDTSGRLHNNKNLMRELLRIKQKLKSISSAMPNNTVLVVDSNCGYNAIKQIEIFQEIIGIDGLVITKTDISKRLGSIVSICYKFKLPIYSISEGEGLNSMYDFNPFIFANNLLKDINIDFK